jgi:outer membrane lipoprotein carrier protein
MATRTSIRIAVLFTAWLLAPGFLPAAAAAPNNPPNNPNDVTAVVGRIEAAYRKAKDVQSDFTQTTQYEGFPTPMISKGRLSIRRPGQMRWDYREPSRHQIYVNGDEVIYFVPEHRQAIRSTMDREVQSPVPLMLLAGAAVLSEQFAVAWEGPPGSAGGRYRLRLTGKHSAASIAPLTIETDANDALIRRVTLHDPSGAVTTFEFSGITLNSGLADGLFTFSPPAGIDVVDAPPLLSPTAPEPRSELPAAP